MIKENNNYSIWSSFKEHYILIVSFSALLCSIIGFWSEYRLLREFGLNIVIFSEIDDFFLAGLKYPKVFIVAFSFFAPGTAYMLFLFYKLTNTRKYVDQSEEHIGEEYKFSKLLLHKIENIPLVNILTLPLEEYIKIDEKKLNQKNNEFKSLQDGREEKISNLRNRIIKEIITYAAISVALVFILLYIELDRHLDRIKDNPSRMATVQLRNKVTIPDNPSQPLVFITATDKFMFFYQHDAAPGISTFAIPISSILSVRYSEFGKKTDNNLE